MRKLTWAGLLTACLVPASTMAQSSFDGTWKISLNNVQFPVKPQVFLLQDGMYDCKTCVPPIHVKANGQDQTVTGNPYFDTINVKVVDAQTVLETDKKNGKIVGTSTTTISKDGKTANFEFTDSSNTNAAPVTGKGASTRVTAGPAGSHAVSGSWRTAKLDNISDNGLVLTFKVDGDSLRMTNQTGQSYAAKLDGTDSPYKGDPGITSVSVKRVDKSTIDETDKRDGKAISITRMTTAADGKTIKFAVNNILQGTKMQFVATKQ